MSATDGIEIRFGILFIQKLNFILSRAVYLSCAKQRQLRSVVDMKSIFWKHVYFAEHIQFLHFIRVRTNAKDCTMLCHKTYVC